MTLGWAFLIARRRKARCFDCASDWTRDRYQIRFIALVGWCCVVFVCCSAESNEAPLPTRSDLPITCSPPPSAPIISSRLAFLRLSLACFRIKEFSSFSPRRTLPHSWTTWNDNKSYFKWRFLSTLIGDRKQRLINLSNGDRIHLKHLFSVFNDFLFFWFGFSSSWDCVIRTVVKLFVNTFCSL